MKEKYVKPTLILERFTMTQNIASGCAPRNEEWGYATHSDKSTCGWALPDGVNIAWLEGTTVCNDFYGEFDEVYGVCYNNPESGMTIFGS